MSNTLLEVQNLKTYFRSGRGKRKVEVRAVDDISFAVRKGETFGLVGESGCGKTTTGRTIIRLYRPSGGTVRFEGHDISGKIQGKAEKLLASQMQMIFQDPMASLNPRMTVEEIVGEGLTVMGLRDRAERLDRVYKMLELVGLSRDHASRYPHEFSGGQRQRIGIARAVITQPSLIIADEPVSALDVSIQAQIINLFNQLKESMNLTVLFIAHNLSIVKYFSDRIGVMYAGKLVEIAPSEELYRNPVHPYTRSLLSAIPQPDPYFERLRKRIPYDPGQHDYTRETPRYFEVSSGHTVYCSELEFKKYVTGR
ncbi:MAG: ABC transporter ATP-binding protein [Spirochaetaceae bacterium]|nr:MAG: ABC transporter ATP-binding protein [Spirochaetaceae bacterium]